MDESEHTRRLRAKLPREAAHVSIWDPTVPDDRPDVPVWQYRSIASGADLIQLYAARFGLELLGESGVTTAASVIELAELGRRSQATYQTGPTVCVGFIPDHAKTDCSGAT